MKPVHQLVEHDTWTECREACIDALEAQLWRDVAAGVAEDVTAAISNAAETQRSAIDYPAEDSQSSSGDPGHRG